MFRRRLFVKVQQATKWKTGRGQHFEDYYCHESAIRLKRYGSIQSTALRAMCTCQEPWDSIDINVLDESEKGQTRCSRRVVQECQHTKGNSWEALKANTQACDNNEAESDSREATKSMGIKCNKENAALYDVEDASESQTEDIEDEYDGMKDESDESSDNDDNTIIKPTDVFKHAGKQSFDKFSEKDKKKEIRKMMDKLVSAAVDEATKPEEGEVPECEQCSLRVGIIGAVNAGKSTLTNLLVGTKVAAVSRKRNTTISEILGIVTNGRTQILLYDTPGLVLDILGTPSKTDTRRRSESAWQLFSHCEVLLVLVDAYRQIHKPDKRVLRLVEKLGAEETSHLKKCLVLNKVDIVENKRLLLPLAQEFGELPGYENIFMVSALKGSGVRDITNYLMDQAVLRPWEEEPDPLNEETIRTLSMEVVREHLLDRVHEEIPYELDQQLVDWQELEDGSLRVEQHFYLPKKGQCRIVVGKGGSKIREIGMKACEELRKLLKRKVHLFLEVRHC